MALAAVSSTSANCSLLIHFAPVCYEYGAAADLEHTGEA